MATLNDALDVLKLIPASFWGVLVGAGVSIIGIAYTNKASQQRLREQFTHEHKIKATEREMGIKKDVYLAAAEAIQAAQVAIAHFPNIEMDGNSINADYLSKAGAIAKVYVVGGTEVIKGLLAVTSVINSVMLELGVTRQILTMELQRFKNIQANHDSCAHRRTQLLDKMRQYNLDIISDKVRWDALNVQFNREQADCIEYNNQLRVAESELMPKRRAFLIQAQEGAERVRGSLPLLLEAVRKELGIPLDMNAVLPYIAENAKNMRESLEGFTNALAQEEKRLNEPVNVALASSGVEHGEAVGTEHLGYARETGISR